eukprot:20688-Heterococcus_DN1.PRE.1
MPAPCICCWCGLLDSPENLRRSSSSSSEMLSASCASIFDASKRARNVCQKIAVCASKVYFYCSAAILQVVFSFRLEANSTILVTAEDADMILYTARKTRLEKREPDDLLDAFRFHCCVDEDVPTADVLVTKAQFDAAIRDA